MALDNPSSPERQTAFMSALVTEHFVLQTAAFRLFAAAILPALFVLALFTTVRLVDTGIENQQFLRGIARIRGYYRTLTPEARVYFSVGRGRWPEAQVAPPLWSGPLVAFLTTAASMIAFLNTSSPARVSRCLRTAGRHDQIRLTVGLGVMATVILMAVFLAYQRRRYRDAEAAAPREEAEPRQ
jgi:hypothetical protein